MANNIAGRVSKISVLLVYMAVILSTILVPATATAAGGVNYAGSSVTGLVEDIIPLPGLSISSVDSTVPLTLSIEDGILSMTTTTGLTFTSSSNTGSTIAFTGSVSDINTALATLRYRSIVPGAKTLNAVSSPAGEVYFPGNGHIYEVVDNGSPMTWDDAKIAAEARTRNGVTGYLATVTTQAENDYLVGKLAGDGWFGASDVATEGDWKWVTGPETGTSFWSGVTDGTPVNGLFSNWSSNEPNDYPPSGEDCGQFYSDGSGWNDLPCDDPNLSYYVVEYGAPGSLPTTPPSASFSVTVNQPATQTVPISSCLDLLNVQNDVKGNRYNNLVMTTDVDCTGETLTPLFNQTDPDFGQIGFKGTFDGQNNTLSNVGISAGSDINVGLFAASSGASFQDITISGNVSGYSCIGGIVGKAVDTSFSNITTNVDVAAISDNAGGIVGCWEANIGTSSMTNSTGYGDVQTTQYGNNGGLIGILETHNTASLIVAGNTFGGTVTASDSSVGGIIGIAYINGSSTFTMQSNTTNGLQSPGSSNVGGLLGYLYTNDSATATIELNQVNGEVRGIDNVGGFIGSADNYSSGGVQALSIKNSHLTTNVISDNGGNTGGIVGYASYIYLYHSSSTGTIDGGDSKVGGLLGYAYGSTITESSSAGTVEGFGDRVGGLVGYSRGGAEILRSYSTANITGDGAVGGLVGNNKGQITDSYSRGTVTGDNDVGGIAGYSEEGITNSYATGLVTANSGQGGILGEEDSGATIDSFWDTETTGQATSDDDATGKTTSEMKTKATFTDTATSSGLVTPWDFTTVWNINRTVNSGYPCLLWQSNSCPIDTGDNDGIPEAVENAAPNSGDANNDGTPDGQQSKVSSLVSPVNNKYVVLESSICAANTAVSINAEPTPTNKDDDDYQYPAGLLGFTLTGCPVGGSETVTQYYYGDYDVGKITLRKYNTANDTYSTIADASLTSVTIGGKKAVKAVYIIEDGGALDADGSANGTIVDPTGIGILSTTAPNTGLAAQDRNVLYLIMTLGAVLMIGSYYSYRNTKKTVKTSL